MRITFSGGRRLQALFAELRLLLRGKENIVNYLYLFVDLFIFFSVFLVLNEVYKQDTERTRMIVRDPNSVAYQEDKEKLLELEKKRIFSFFTAVPLLVAPSLVGKIHQNRDFLLRMVGWKITEGTSLQTPPPSR